MKEPGPIVYFFSDFGPHGPYTGQVEAVIRDKTQAQFINLLLNAPAADPYHSAYLLAALYDELPVKSGYMLAVVDPGVGSERQVITFQIGGMTFLGPDNGLFSRLIANYGVDAVDILLRPDEIKSDSFHARDWFAPQLVRLMNGRKLETQTVSTNSLAGVDWPEQISRIIYVDHYGNLMTGLYAANLHQTTQFRLSGHEIRYARTFSEVLQNKLFWYRNSMGLVEIAAGSSSAAGLLRAGIGDMVEVINA